MIETAARLGVPYRLFTAAELEAQAGKLANPSEVVFAEVGCHGVSEGAALALGGALVVEKRKTANATCAVARSEAPITAFAGRARGRLSIVGIGPGQASWRTPEVSKLVAEAEELVGYGLYIDLLGPLAVGKTRSDFPLGGEEARCRYALEQAALGKSVALVCSGDAGIYAMGALVFELMDRGADEMGVSDAARRVEVVCSPGVSALQGAAARAGAPLGHDFCAINLSDNLKPWALIEKRLRLAAEADFAMGFYNPRSKARPDGFSRVLDILRETCEPERILIFARAVSTPEQNIQIVRLSDALPEMADMRTVVLVGSSLTRIIDGGARPIVYTPRSVPA